MYLSYTYLPIIINLFSRFCVVFKVFSTVLLSLLLIGLGDAQPVSVGTVHHSHTRSPISI